MGRWFKRIRGRETRAQLVPETTYEEFKTLIYSELKKVQSPIF